MLGSRSEQGRGLGSMVQPELFLALALVPEPELGLTVEPELGLTVEPELGLTVELGPMHP
jgi:hypothetical protein